MNSLLHHCILIFIPLILANSIHMLIVKHNLLSSLVIPIANGIFGANKTLRGFVVVPVLSALMMFFTGIILEVSSLFSFLLGLILGLGYLLSELPNSWLKRRLNIPAGGTHPKYKLFFQILDKVDSAFGVAMIYFLIGEVNLVQALSIFAVGVMIHVLVSLLLLKVSVKKAF